MGENVNIHNTHSTRSGSFKRTMASEALKSMRNATKERTKQKRDTDSGMTPAQRKSVKDYEDRIQRLKTERVALIGADGSVMAQSSTGSRTRTKLAVSRSADYSDAVITHNHPTNEVMGGNLAGRVNNTFSPDDMRSVITTNAKEIRVRSGGGYIYSLRRNGDTWGVDANSFQREHNALVGKYLREETNGRQKVTERELRSQSREDIMRGMRGQRTSTVQNINARINVTAQHRAMKELAKKYGWTYTHRKA